jgi:cytoskeletal protein CcmA (bactofilin family)
MWSNKRAETEVPLPSVPASPQVQEINANKPISASTDGVAFTAEAVRPATTTPARETARLGASLHVKGEISGQEALHVDGIVEGLIQLEGAKLTVGASAKLTADIVATEIVVHGSVKGNVHAHDRIEIKKDSSVVGGLTSPTIRVEDGAYLNGAIEILRKSAERAGSQETAYGRSVSALDRAEKIAS